MKKALLALGFAMCSTFAFAQTQSTLSPDRMLRTEKIPTSSLDAQKEVDYKASIFTKDSQLDTLRTFSFSSTDMSDITFGTIGSSDHINVDGHDSIFNRDAHSIPGSQSWAAWKRYADSADLVANFATDYPTWINRLFFGASANASTPDEYSWLLQRMKSSYNDGFMVFAYDNNNGQGNIGNVNVYMELPVVPRTDAHHVVAVSVSQFYYSFYDQCFVDYQIGTTWYTREINVNGIDVEVNSTAAYKARFVMPYNLVDQANIKLRIRVSAQKYAAYGYAWFLDDVAVINDLRAESWEFHRGSALDGLYGMIPQNMTIPVTYGIHVRNTNISDINNARLVITNAPAGGSFTTVAEGTPFTLVSGNTTKDYKMYINERGFMCTTNRDDTLFDWGAHSMLGQFENYGNQGALTGGYQGRSLNTSTLGPNFYAIKAQGGTGLVTELDTVLYTVSDYFEFTEAADSNRIDGYRWARDNGLIPRGSIFKVGFTADHYLDADDDAEHVFNAGYGVFLRYVTGSEVPNDFVFRGVEYIPHTTLQNQAGEFVDGNMATDDYVLVPIIYEEVADGEGGLDWVELPCGIAGSAYKITPDAVSNLPQTYALPGSESNYSAVNIQFPDQPRLKKNTAYLFGYQLNEDAQFAVAKQQWGYVEDGQTVRYNANEATAPYYRQNSPIMPLEVLVYDYSGTNNSGSHWIYGWNIDNYPMIRPIVGTPQALPTVSVRAENCTNNNMDTLGVTVERGTDNLCHGAADVAIGSNQSFDIYPIGEHSVITAIKVNGQTVPEYVQGGDVPDGNMYIVASEDNVMEHRHGGEYSILDRYAYTLHINGIADNADGYVITAEYSWEPWDLSGIDPVAPESYLHLSPNPATNSVKLDIAGVTGMVNCSIIDMSGRVVYNANINAEVETTLNVSSMPAGAYFVRVTNDTFSKIEKLIIK